MRLSIDDAVVASSDFIRRTGATSIQIRYSDDEEPVVWFVVAIYPDGRWETASGHSPDVAAIRLCETLGDGAECTHCHRPTGVTTEIDTMPLDKMVCWYQFDPETKKFRRGCE